MTPKNQQCFPSGRLPRFIKFITTIIVCNICFYSACSNSPSNYYVFNYYNGEAIAVLCVRTWRLEYPDDAIENVFYITKTQHGETNGKKAFDQNGYLIGGADKKAAILSTTVLLDDKSVVLSITFDINIKGCDFHNETIIDVPLFQDVKGVEDGLAFTATWRQQKDDMGGGRLRASGSPDHPMSSFCAPSELRMDIKMEEEDITRIMTV